MIKSKLEEIKSNIEYNRFGSKVVLDESEYNYLIQQAEKMEKKEYWWMEQHRKRCNELEDAYFKIQLIENQLHQQLAKAEHYKQTLEEIARGRFPGASYKARQALEGLGMSKKPLEEIEEKYSTLTVSSEKNGTEYTEVDVKDLVFLIQNGFKQAERVQELEKENKRYREALEFYADRDNYKLEHFDYNLDDYMSTVDYDEGQIAREALEGESNE